MFIYTTFQVNIALLAISVPRNTVTFFLQILLRVLWKKLASEERRKVTSHFIFARTMKCKCKCLIIHCDQTIVAILILLFPACSERHFASEHTKINHTSDILRPPRLDLHEESGGNQAFSPKKSIFDLTYILNKN